MTPHAPSKDGLPTDRKHQVLYDDHLAEGHDEGDRGHSGHVAWRNLLKPHPAARAMDLVERSGEW